MRCNTARELMTRQLRETLEPEQERRLAQHLRQCPACQAEAQELAVFEAKLARSLPHSIEELPVHRPAARQIAALAARRRSASVWRGAVGAGTGVVAFAALWAAMPRVYAPGHVQQAMVRERIPGVQRKTVSFPANRLTQAPPAPETPASEALAPKKRHGGILVQPPIKAATATTAVPIPDGAYLDGSDPRLTAWWMAGRPDDSRVRAWLVQKLGPVKDDFVDVPLPRLVNTDLKSEATRDAIHQYEKEAAVVDPRLFRKVTLHLKAAPLSEVCDALAKETGVRVAASRGVADENATVLVKERPAREIMREVARLFGYRWARAGEEGAYTYELLQDLRSQLAEEEMRNRDRNAALLALDEEMGRYQPFLRLSRADLKARAERAKGDEKALLDKLQGDGWSAAQMYFHLSPQQRTALAAGQVLVFSSHSDSPDLQLPPELRVPVLQGRDITLGTFEGEEAIVERGFGQPGTPLFQLPDATASVTLSMSRSELGQLSLHGSSRVGLSGKPDIRNMFWAGQADLADAASPSVTNPGNATANAALKKLPEFAQVVSFKPEPSCPWYLPDRQPADQDGFRLPLGGGSIMGPDGKLTNKDRPHVQTADIWDVVHQATGRSIIADAYLHAYDQQSVSVGRSTLYDALCQIGDQTHTRWQKDGDYLLARSTSYFWDKLKEPPVRLLRRWWEDRKRGGLLPVDDVLQMATLSDAQLDSSAVGFVVGHCWNLEEWGIVGTGGAFRLGLPGGGYIRRYARFLATLNPAQRAQAMRPDGIGWNDLQPGQRDALASLLIGAKGDPQVLDGIRLRMDYAPVGTYLWHPVVNNSREAEMQNRKWPPVVARTAEEALAIARKYNPTANADEINKSRGALTITFQNARGDFWNEGGPGVAWRINQ